MLLKVNLYGMGKFMEGKKDDIGKLRYDCIPIMELEECARVMTYGAKKYNENPQNPNWINVEDGFNRYFAALMRHLEEVRKGNQIDEDSGLSHMAHAIFNVMALSHFDRERHNI